MNRREFIGIAAAGAATLAWTPAASGLSNPSHHLLTSPRLLGILHDRQYVHDLGQRFCALMPAAKSPEALAGMILAEVESAGKLSLHARLEERVRQDFVEGRTVLLNGWVLSLTEARQCALFSLLGA